MGSGSSPRDLLPLDEGQAVCRFTRPAGNFKLSRDKSRNVREMAKNVGLDLLVGLLYARGPSGRVGEPIRGVTRLEKLIFLALNEGGFSEAISDYAYKPYELGPYSSEVLDYVEALKQAKLLQADTVEFDSHRDMLDAVAATGSVDAAGEPGTMEVYRLTDKGLQVGEKIFTSLGPTRQHSLEQLKKRFNGAPLGELLKYVYSNYRDMTVKSKILDDVLGVGSRPNLEKAA